MNILVFSIFLALHTPGDTTNKNTIASPLASYSSAWNNPAFLKCNTAKKANYFSASEKELIYILNLVRTNPKLFANTVLKKYPDEKGQSMRNSKYYTSLMDTLLKMESRPLLYPDSLAYVSATCHAITSGESSYVGHERMGNCKKIHHGESCDYGHEKPLDIILSLLIDEGVPSLGHRYICMGFFHKIGVAIRPHKYYGHNAVLDFLFF